MWTYAVQVQPEDFDGKQEWENVLTLLHKQFALIAKAVLQQDQVGSTFRVIDCNGKVVDSL
jgi:hypothetical protein